MNYVETDYDRVRRIASDDIATLIIKNAEYGSSWRRRGGVGAFMMLARKWDRIESQCSGHGFNIFGAACSEGGKIDEEGIIDDIRDLRCYLLLVEEHIRNNPL